MNISKLISRFFKKNDEKEIVPIKEDENVSNSLKYKKQKKEIDEYFISNIS
jgi:hypothetical protein